MKKWTKKISDYGTNGYFISPFYGEDLPQAPDYNETTNPDGYGGPKHPFKSLEKFYQESGRSWVGIFDDGYYLISTVTSDRTLVSENNAVFDSPSGNYSIRFSSIKFYDAIILAYYETATLYNCNSSAHTTHITSPFYDTVSNNASIGQLRGGIFRSTILNPLSNLNWSAYDIDSSIIIEESRVLTIKTSVVKLLDYNIIVAPLGIKIDDITYPTLSDAQIAGHLVHSFSLEDLGLDIWQDLFTNPIGANRLNYMYADLSISANLNQRIYDNQITNHGKTPTEATAIATSGVQKVMNGGQYGGYIGAKPMATRIDADALWNTYKASSVNLEYTSGNLITTDNTQVGIYESLEIPFGKKIVVENGNLANEVAYQLHGWVDARVSADDYEVIDNLVEQRAILVYELSFYQDPNEDNTGNWTGFKRFEVNAPLRIDNAGNGNQDSGYDDTQAQVIHDVTKFKLRFEMRKVACGVHPDKPCI